MAEKIIIICGGEPLPGCPESWEEAHKWEDQANNGKTNHEPWWRFDCGYKLDFDGELLFVSSRFYPPKTHYGQKWRGSVELIVKEQTVESAIFEATSLDELKKQVEPYIKDIRDRIMKLFLQD